MSACVFFGVSAVRSGLLVLLALAVFHQASGYVLVSTSTNNSQYGISVSAYRVQCVYLERNFL